jgi:PAS domain S-box-containing protein
MIVEPHVSRYQTLLAEYLFTEDDLAREASLTAVDDLAQALLPLRVSMDELLTLHSRAKARLADQWGDQSPNTEQQRALFKLARGDDLPVMLALLLPEQVQERQLAEQRWHAEHARLAAVFEQTEDFVLVFDSAGRIEYLNPSFIRATGHTLPQAQSEPASVWNHTLPQGGTHYLELDLVRATGQSVPTAWSISTVASAGGAVLNHVCIGRDISHQRQYTDALQQNDRLRAVATLAAGIAHDFNNLLGSIQGLTEVCQAMIEPGTGLARNLEGIHRASLRAADLVSQMLGFAREQRSEPAAMDLGAWLEGTQVLLAASLPRGVKVRLNVTDHLRVLADAGQLEQVVLNLVKNAGYAMRHNGGVVRLDADEWSDEHGHCWARLQVADEGEGIPPGVLPRIFDPFFTTKPVGEGTGLGLAAAYGIVRQHRGDIQVKSESGKGTTFSLLLPLVATSGGWPSARDVETTAGAEVASWYEVNAQDLLTAVSDDWNVFALENDGAQCVADRVLGRPLAGCISGEGVQQNMQSMLDRARETGKPQVASYRCDSPAELRTMEMQLLPSPDGRVRVVHRVLSREPRSRKAQT